MKRGGVDGGKVCVLGGSHGGFLTVHLVGQFPVSKKRGRREREKGGRRERGREMKILLFKHLP